MPYKILDQSSSKEQKYFDGFNAWTIYNNAYEYGSEATGQVDMDKLIDKATEAKMKEIGYEEDMKDFIRKEMSEIFYLEETD